MTLPKFVLVFVMYRIIDFLFAEYTFYLSLLFIAVGLSSVFVGTFFALSQWKLRKFLAYSGIVNMGFVVLAFSVFSEEAYLYAFFYLIIYIFLSLNLFSWLFVLKKVNSRGEFVFLEDITDFTGLYSISPLATFAIAAVFFSYAGIPPFLGFFSKFFLLYILVVNGYFIVVFFLLLCSAVALVYYLFFVKIMFFSSLSPKEIKIVDGFPLLLASLLTLFNFFGIFVIDFVFSFGFFLF